MEVEGYTISFNRGDQVIINVKNKADTLFEIGDTIKFSITKQGDITNVLLQKVFTVEEESNIFGVLLTPEDTRKICPPFKSGSKTYWYEIEHNEITTLIGCDKNGGKEIILYPEAIAAEEGE